MNVMMEKTISKSLGKGYPSLTYKIYNEIGTRKGGHLKTHI